MKNNQLKNLLIVAVLIILVVSGILLLKDKVADGKNNTTQNVADTSQDTDTSNGQVAGTSTSSGITQKDTDFILFYGSTCPHCKKVDEFISQYNITKYLKFQQLEVFENEDNANLMTEKQSQCKDLADSDKGGVPFLYSSQKCIVGDQPVIDFLKQQAGI